MMAVPIQDNKRRNIRPVLGQCTIIGQFFAVTLRGVSRIS